MKITDIIGKINYTREVRAFAKYAKLNALRKGAQNSNKIFKMLDDARRKTGFVK